MRVCFVSQMQDLLLLQNNGDIAYNRFLLVWTAENEHPQLVRMEVVNSTLEVCLKKLSTPPKSQ